MSSSCLQPPSTSHKPFLADARDDGRQVTYDEVVGALRAAGCVFAEDEARMIIDAAGGGQAELERLMARRCAGEPLELVVGYAEFAGRRIAVRLGVFVPRQRSERLVRAVAERLEAVRRQQPVVVDLGCGSGALLVALLGMSEAPLLSYAIDTSPVAAECARENLEGTGAYVIEDAGLAALPDALRGQVDVIMANLPYVPTDSIPLLPREARLYEPFAALDGGSDGLGPLESALAEVGAWLRPSGHYLGELHESQVESATRLASRYGFFCTASVDPDDRTAVVDLVAERAG
jgi:release factor glutamine methyltransferase